VLTPDEWQAVWITLKVAATAVVATLPVAIAVGWLLAKRNFPGKFLVETLISLPLVMPPVVTGYLLLIIFGRNGVCGAVLEDWLGLRFVFDWKGAALAAAVVGFPLLVRSIRVAFEGVDPRLYQVARSLGAGPFDAFWTVSLPLARHGLIAGVVLAFARGIGEFGATMMFASIRPETTTLAIQIYILHNQPGDLSEARMWRVVIASVLLAFSSLVVSEYLVRRGRQHELA